MLMVMQLLSIPKFNIKKYSSIKIGKNIWKMMTKENVGKGFSKILGN
jgi:hypothetical protein